MDLGIDVEALITLITAVIGFLLTLYKLVTAQVDSNTRQNTHNQTAQSALLNTVAELMRELLVKTNGNKTP